MDQMISLLTIHTNCVHLIHRPAAPAVVANLYDIVQQPDEPVSVHSESNNVGSNSRQLFEIETDRNSEESVDSITAASLHCSDASLPTSPADLAPNVADMRTEGPVTFSPLPHHVHDHDKETRTSRQLCYASRHVSSTFLSCCGDLGFIRENFPGVGSCDSQSPTSVQSLTAYGPTKCHNSGAQTSSMESSCSCPSLEIPPQPPPQHHHNVNGLLQTKSWPSHLPSSSQQNLVGDI